MKRTLALVLAVTCLTGIVGIASANQNNTGCGLGSIIFKGQDGLMSQTCAATFNGIYGNQTFGITTGTSNCQKATSLTSNEKLDKFVSDNMDNLAVDISKGSGEYLSTLAVLLDTPVPERPALYQRLQTSFSQIYTSESVTHLDVLNNIEKVLNQPS
jgi:opacity protein-like surface antigen